jgi:tellurite resistance protein TerC
MMDGASLHVTTAAWLATIGLIAAVLAFDLVVSGRRPQTVGFKEAVAQSIFSVFSYSWSS